MINIHEAIPCRLTLSQIEAEAGRQWLVLCPEQSDMQAEVVKNCYIYKLKGAKHLTMSWPRNGFTGIRRPVL
jgi:hypothetical protein